MMRPLIILYPASPGTMRIYSGGGQGIVTEDTLTARSRADGAGSTGCPLYAYAYKPTSQQNRKAPQAMNGVVFFTLSCKDRDSRPSLKIAPVQSSHMEKQVKLNGNFC